MSRLFSTLPPSVYSLADFNLAAKHWEDVQESHADVECAEAASRELVNFVLTGQHQSDGHQAVVDPLCGNGIREDEEILATRDYDSLLGIADDLYVKGPIYIFPVSNSMDMLTSSIHLTHPMEDGSMSFSPPAVHPFSLTILILFLE